jgi:polyisoprenyl-phosphate glycosyltransferase
LGVRLPGAAIVPVTGSPPRLDIVLPCFNEADVLLGSYQALSGLLDDMVARLVISRHSCMWFVDDGSRDETWSIIRQLSSTDRRVCGIRLSRNRGHQNAILAGLLRAEGDLVVTIDADLQDDISCIEKMIDANREGAQIVYGVRSDRSVDPWLKKATAFLYYTIARRLGIRFVDGHADFRMMSRAAVEALRGYGESNLFLRALIPELGFKSATVKYRQSARRAGDSKYTWSKMMALSLDGITSFSAVPLRLIALGGFIIFFISMGLVGYGLATSLVFDTAIPGWASTVVPMYALGGLQLLALGVVGEYVAKTYLEAKRRPRYVVEEIIPADGGSLPANSEKALTITQGDMRSVAERDAEQSR